MSITSIINLDIDSVKATIDFSNVMITYDFMYQDKIRFTLHKEFRNVSFMLWEFISNNFMSYKVKVEEEPYKISECHNIEVSRGTLKRIDIYNRIFELYDLDKHLVFITDGLTDEDFKNILNYSNECLNNSLL